MPKSVKKNIPKKSASRITTNDSYTGTRNRRIDSDRQSSASNLDSVIDPGLDRIPVLNTTSNQELVQGLNILLNQCILQLQTICKDLRNYVSKSIPSNLRNQIIS